MGGMSHGHDNAVSVKPGKTGSLTMTFAEAGTLIVGCHEPGHYAAGMRAIFIRRGPWAFLQATDGPPPEASATIDSLLELPEVVARLG